MIFEVPPLILIADRLDTVYAEIFANFAICSHWRNFYHTNFLSRVNDYIEDMVTFTALAKIYSTNYFCNTKDSGIGKIFVKSFHVYDTLFSSHIAHKRRALCVTITSVVPSSKRRAVHWWLAYMLPGPYDNDTLGNSTMAYKPDCSHALVPCLSGVVRPSNFVYS